MKKNRAPVSRSPDILWKNGRSSGADQPPPTFRGVPPFVGPFFPPEAGLWALGALEALGAFAALGAFGVFSAFAFILAITYLALKITGFGFPVGNPTIVIVVTFFSGIQLLSLGVMGEYVGRIYDEVRERPKYIVESRHGFDDES